MAESADEDLTSNRLLKQLECPVCFEYCVPPIFMCKNGHNVCSTCRESLTQCAICRELGKPSIRNLAVEGISNLIVKVKCKNAVHGCQAMFSMQEIQKHLPKCEFNCDYECRFDCRWKGNFADLKTHVQSEHSSRFWECFVDTPVTLNLVHTHFCYCLTLLECGGCLFWYRHEYDNDTTIFALVVEQAKRDDDPAVQFSCSVKLASKNEKNKLQIVSVANDGSSKCHVLLKDIVESYKDDQTIPFQFSIDFVL